MKKVLLLFGNIKEILLLCNVFNKRQNKLNKKLQ